MEWAIETRGLRKTYGRKTEALKPMDLQVPLGSCFGLLGPNGAGKSTLVKTLLSITHASGGDATLLGRDFRGTESRRRIGYLPEGHNFPGYLDGRGVCRYFGRLAGLSGDALEKGIEEKLELVGMAESAKVKISKCSKGMKQRIGLAQALLGDPRLVFLDEPTDGIDPVGRAEVREVIKDIARRGVTVFLNSHLLSEVELMCDRIAIMDKGRILQSGSVQEIVASVGAKDGRALVRFRCSAIPEALLQELIGMGATADAEGFSLPTADAAATTSVIDRLRQAGVTIAAVEPRRLSLEDAFIRLVSEDEGASS